MYSYDSCVYLFWLEKSVLTRKEHCFKCAVFQLARDLWSFELQSQETCLKDCEKTVMMISGTLMNALNKF